MKNPILFLYALAMMSCSQVGSPYTIEGTMEPKVEGEMIYLSRINEAGEFEKIDSTRVSDGSFTFSGRVEEPYLAQVSTADQKRRPCAFIIEEGEIDVACNAYATATGTPINDLIQTSKTETFATATVIQDLRYQMNEHKKEETLTPEIEQELTDKYYAVQERSMDFAKEFAIANAKSMAGLYVLYYNMHLFSFAEVQVILDLAQSTEGHTRLYKKLKDREVLLARRQMGAPLTDITLPNLDGELDSLSNYIGNGKYVLLDFWASWCGPCLKEIPELVELYNQYKDKGFEIVGISLDNDEASWKGAIERNKMNWPHMSDLKGWASEGALAYGVNSIPVAMLFDPSGTIIAIDVQAKDLGKTLDNYLD